MFRGLFGKHNDEEDEYFEAVDPVVEQRRKEKFSTPLIYDEEFSEEMEAEKKVEKKTDRKVEKKVSNKIKKDIPIQPEAPTKSGYQMMEVISPMRGITGCQAKKAEKAVPKKNKKRKPVDQLVPVISPFYGAFEEKEEEEVEPVVLKAALEEKVVEEKPKEKLPTVEDNLRNIAKIVEEEKDQLKIIEERTGEFKLDFSNAEDDAPTSLIDEIDDNMSLDELMSLYEKKFTD